MTTTNVPQATPLSLAAPLLSASLPSPVGELRLFARGPALVAVLFPEHRHAWPFTAMAEHQGEASRSGGPSPVLQQAAAELQSFFAGKQRAFSTPLAFEAGTPFFHEVWRALLALRFGERTSYGALARRLGRPAAARAVGAAVGRNPLSIFVPCHRVVGENGRLTGFAGGLPAKQWLLRHEGEGLLLV